MTLDLTQDYYSKLLGVLGNIIIYIKWEAILSYQISDKMEIKNSRTTIATVPDSSIWGLSGNQSIMTFVNQSLFISTWS